MKGENGISDINSLLSETENNDKVPINGLSAQQKMIFQFVEEKGQIISHQAELLLKVK